MVVLKDLGWQDERRRSSMLRARWPHWGALLVVRARHKDKWADDRVARTDPEQVVWVLEVWARRAWEWPDLLVDRDLCRMEVEVDRLYRARAWGSRRLRSSLQSSRRRGQIRWERMRARCRR